MLHMHVTTSPLDQEMPTSRATDSPVVRPSRAAAAIAGLLAGSAALAFSELLAGLVAGAPSLIIAVGGLVIALQPPGAKQFVVDLFGQADKLLLNLLIGVVALAAATALGILARSRPRLAAAGFAAGGAIGLYAALQDPLVDPLLSVLTVLSSVAVALWVLRALLGLAVRPRPGAEMPDWDRRRFLGTSLAVAGVAVGSGLIGRTLLANGRGSQETARVRFRSRSRRRHHCRAGSAWTPPGSRRSWCRTLTSTGSIPPCSCRAPTWGAGGYGSMGWSTTRSS